MEMIELMRHEQVRGLHLDGCKQAQVFNAQLEYLKNECSSSVKSAETKSGEVFGGGLS